MRITAKIVSSGDSWQPIFPRIDDLKYAFPIRNGKEVYDSDVGLTMLKHDRITHATTDNKLVQCVACILIDTVNRWMEEYEIGGKVLDKIRPRFDRKISAGKVSYCRIDLTPATIGPKSQPTVRIRISVDDNGVVAKRRYERLFAWAVADMVVGLSEKFEKNGGMPLVIGEDIEALKSEMREWIAEEEQKDDIRKRNGERLFCPNYCHGACSPSKFDCPNYKNGNCIEIKEEE